LTAKLRKGRSNEIEVRSYDPIEAAAIVNEVAKVFRGQPRQTAVEVIDLATAPGRPIFPSLRLAISIKYRNGSFSEKRCRG